MRFLLLVTFIAAAAAEAEPEADPYFYYGFGLPYAAHAAAAPAITYTLPKCTNNDGAVVPCAHPGYPYLYGGYGYYPFGLVPTAAAAAEEPAAVEEARKKRDADPEADPAVLATYSVVKNPLPALYHGLGHALPYTAGLPYAHAGLTYAGLPYAGLPYAHGYAGYGYGYPLLHAVAAPATDEAAVEEARKKREAEPEADPWLYYSGGLGHGYGYGYAGYGYPYTYGHYPYAYTGVGCRNYLGAAVPCAGR